MVVWVRSGPISEHEIVRWRCVDLRDEIAREFGAQLHERAVGKLTRPVSSDEGSAAVAGRKPSAAARTG